MGSGGLTILISELVCHILTLLLVVYNCLLLQRCTCITCLISHLRFNKTNFCLVTAFLLICLVGKETVKDVVGNFSTYC